MTEVPPTGPVPPPGSGAECVQLLRPDGTRVTHPEYACDLTPDELRTAYRDLVLSRRLDAEATALQRQGELGLWAGMLGQEAAQVGSARALSPQDYVFPSYREHAVAWCRGIDPLTLLGMFRGVTHGGWDPVEHGFHLYAIVIGSQPLHAAGYAMGLQRDGLVGTGDPSRDAAVLVYFGDGATSQGDVSEALVFASVFQAPVVFFCQNNQWAISAPVQRQSRVPLRQRASGFGVPGVRVDGNDVLAVHAVTRAALDRARAGEGPTMIEAYTYRMGAHTTSDDPTRYRSAAEVEEWGRHDPIERVRSLLRAEGLLDDEAEGALAEEADALAARMRAGCRAMPDPDPADIFRHVYREEHPLLDQEREWFAGYQASFLSQDPGAGSPQGTGAGSPQSTGAGAGTATR